VVGPANLARQRIRERNVYNPVSQEKAHRGSVPGWKGSIQPTVKLPGDMVIDELNTYTIGEQDEQSARAPGAQKR